MFATRFAQSHDHDHDDHDHDHDHERLRLLQAAHGTHFAALVQASHVQLRVMPQSPAWTSSTDTAWK